MIKIYKCLQSRSTCEVIVFLIKLRPMQFKDAAFMHYSILNQWEIETIGM